MSIRTAPPPPVMLHSGRATASSADRDVAVRQPGSGRRPAAPVLVGALLALVIGLTAVLASVGCQRMREVAPLDSTTPAGQTVTGYSWSLRPAGFTVRYDDGSSTTRLWW